MQPFLSGETTLALLLTVLTLLFFAAAGDEHPYEPYHHSLPVEAGRSSVDLSSEQPQIKGQELIVRLNGLQTHNGEDHQSVPAKEDHPERRSAEVTIAGRSRGTISFQATTTKPPRLLSSPSPFIPTSRLLRPPRNLQILVAALLSHRSHRRRSLHIATPFSTVLKSGADMSWLLEALLLLLGLGLPMVTTKKTSSLRCPTRSRRRKSVRFVAVGGDHDEQQQIGQKRQREICGGGEEETDELQHQQQQLQDLGLGLGLTRSVVEVC